MAKKVTNIEVKDTTVRTIKHEGEDFVCITDIARQKNSDDPNGVIANWMRNRNTIEFLGIWEQLFNPSFNPLEFEGFRKEAGLNAFTMSPSRWIEATNAKAGFHFMLSNSDCKGKNEEDNFFDVLYGAYHRTRIFEQNGTPNIVCRNYNIN